MGVADEGFALMPQRTDGISAMMGTRGESNTVVPIDHHLRRA